jgi:putative ABC transport system ATP-binding protein
MSNEAIRADRLYRFFRTGDEETLALQGVSLELLPGELVAIVGPSGSGKSTLLSCLIGVLEPSGGTVWVNGERITHRSEATRAKLRADHIGFMGQRGNLFDHLTTTANVRLAQKLSSDKGTNPADVLAAVGLSDRGTSYPSQLSGGETARAGLAVAIANDPDVLIADEPTGELDHVNEKVLLDLLRARADDGKAVLVASHSTEVQRAADRVLVLEDGRVAP